VLLLKNSYHIILTLFSTYKKIYQNENELINYVAAVAVVVVAVDVDVIVVIVVLLCCCYE
jgi:hypothetical protein